MRRILLATLILAALPVSAQDVRLRGHFNRLLAPEADARPETGEVRAILEDDGDLRVDLVVTGLTERATSATLHIGRGSETGDQVARMDVVVNGVDGRVIGATADLTPAVAERVREGEAFVLVRTNEHPDGLLRAELRPQARSLDSVVTGD